MQIKHFKHSEFNNNVQVAIVIFDRCTVSGLCMQIVLLYLQVTSTTIKKKAMKIRKLSWFSKYLSNFFASFSVSFFLVYWRIYHWDIWCFLSLLNFIERCLVNVNKQYFTCFLTSFFWTSFFPFYFFCFRWKKIERLNLCQYKLIFTIFTLYFIIMHV